MRTHHVGVKFITITLSVVLFSESILTTLAEASLWDSRQPIAAAHDPFNSASRAPLFTADHQNQFPISKFALDTALIRPVSAVAPFSVLRKVRKSKNSQKYVLLFQDVHKNTEAQFNLEACVTSLQDKISLFGLEGDNREVRLQTFQNFSSESDENKKIISSVGDYLLKSGAISGPVRAGMTASPNSVHLRGIEEPVLYKNNIQAVKNALLIQPRVRQQLAQLTLRLEQGKKKNLNTSLKSFDESVQRFRLGQVRLSDHIELLTSSLPDMIPSFETFREALFLEGQLNFDLVEWERKRLLDQLVLRLNSKESDRLLSSSLAYKAGQISTGDFYRGLSLLCQKSKISLAQFPHMRDYIQYVLLSDSIDPETLLNLVQESENEIYSGLFKSRSEKKLIDTSNQLNLIQKLVDFSLSSSEWRRFQKLDMPIDSLTLTPFLDFYRLAEARNRAMAENLLDAMNNEKTTIAAMVAGGYHADGILEELTQRGVTVLSFTPKLTKVDSQSGSDYLNLFAQEKTPLDDLFEGQPLFLAANPGEKLSHAPFLSAALASRTSSKLIGLNVLKILAPLFKFNSGRFFTKNNSVSGIINTDQGNVHVQVKTNAAGAIESAQINLLSNSHFWSLIFASAAHLIFPLSDHALMSIAILWLTAKIGLWAGVALDESAHLTINGTLSPSTIKEAFHQKKLWQALMTGQELNQPYVENSLDSKSQIRLSGFLGLFSHVVVFISGFSLISLGTSAWGGLGATLTMSSAFLFLNSFFFGTDFSALLSGQAKFFSCGIGGYIERRTRNEQATMNPDFDRGVSLKPDSRTKKAKRDKQSLYRMGFNTKRRGFQSAGMMETVIMPQSNNRYIWMIGHPLYATLYLFLKWMGWIYFASVSELEIEGPYGKDARNIDDPDDRAVQMALKLVNTKRGEIITRLLLATGWLHKIALFKGYEPHPSIIDPSFHTRFATGGPTERKEAHPHQFMKPRIVKMWRFVGGRIQATYKVLSTWIDHNGDFNGILSPKIKTADGKETALWPLFETEKDKKEVSAWLQKVLGTVDKSKGDSPKISGMMDLLITQGMWFASVRLAYQMVLAKNMNDALTKDELNALNEIFDEIMIASKDENEILFPQGTTSFSQVNKDAIPFFISNALTKLSSNEKLRKLTRTWTEAGKKDFIEMALQSFLYNDPQQAMRLLFALSAKGSTFGLLVDSTFNSTKKYVAASTQPMFIGHDPEQERVAFASDTNAAKSGLPNFDKPGTRVMYLEQGGENGREIAVLNHTGKFDIYAYKRHRDLRKDEIDVRWAPTKDNARLTRPPEPVHSNMLDRDLDLITDEINGVHDRWTDPKKKDLDNLAAADHYFQQILSTVKEIDADLRMQLKRGEKVIIKRPLTPDLLFVGLENSFVAVREFAVQLKRLYPHLNIQTISANDFNVAWHESATRGDLMGPNTTVLVLSRHGGTFPSQNATEVISELKKKSVPPGVNKTTEDIKPHPKKEEEILAHLIVEIEKSRTDKKVREIFTITEQPDSEMARTVGQSLKPSDAASKRVFSIKGSPSMSEPAPLAVAKTHQFFTELLIYISERMLAEQKLSPIAGFTLTPEGLVRLKKADERVRLQTVPGLTGKQPNNPGAEINTPQRKELLQISKLVGKHIREFTVVTIIMTAYTLLTVNFGFTLFQFWGTQALSLLASIPWPMKLALVSGTALLIGTGLKFEKTKRFTQFAAALIIIPAFLIILPHLLNLALGYSFMDQTTLVMRAAKFWDSIFYVLGGWALVLLFRFKDGRQLLGRFVGTRTFFFVDRPGVAEIAYVYFTKVFSKSFGHNGAFAKQGNPAGHFLQYESHTANPGDIIITGSPDSRRKSQLIKNALVPAAEMATSQTQFTVNSLRNGTGPQTISVSQKIKGGSPDIRATLWANDSEIEADNAVSEHELVNNFIENRFDGFERLLWIFIFTNEVQKTVSFFPGLRWDGSNTQSFAGTHTTPAPLPPIELNEDAKNRNLKAVADILIKESEMSAESMWVPKGVGAYYAALLYDPHHLPHVRRPSLPPTEGQPKVKSPPTPEPTAVNEPEAPFVGKPDQIQSNGAESLLSREKGWRKWLSLRTWMKLTVWAVAALVGLALGWESVKWSVERWTEYRNKSKSPPTITSPTNEVVKAEYRDLPYENYNDPEITQPAPPAVVTNSVVSIKPKFQWPKLNFDFNIPESFWTWSGWKWLGLTFIFGALIWRWTKWVKPFLFHPRVWKSSLFLGAPALGYAVTTWNPMIGLSISGLISAYFLTRWTSKLIAWRKSKGGLLSPSQIKIFKILMGAGALIALIYIAKPFLVSLGMGFLSHAPAIWTWFWKGALGLMGAAGIGIIIYKSAPYVKKISSQAWLRLSQGLLVLTGAGALVFLISLASPSIGSYVSSTAIPIIKNHGPAAWYWTWRVVAGVLGFAGIGYLLKLMISPVKKVSPQKWSLVGKTILGIAGVAALIYLLTLLSPALSALASSTILPLAQTLWGYKTAIWVSGSLVIVGTYLWKKYSAHILGGVTTAKITAAKKGPALLKKIFLIASVGGVAYLVFLGIKATGLWLLSLNAAVWYWTLGLVSAGAILYGIYYFRQGFFFLIRSGIETSKNISLPKIPPISRDVKRAGELGVIIAVVLLISGMCVKWTISNLINEPSRDSQPLTNLKQEKINPVSAEPAPLSKPSSHVAPANLIRQGAPAHPERPAAAAGLSNSPAPKNENLFSGNTEAIQRAIYLRIQQFGESDPYAKLLQEYGAVRDLNVLIPNDKSSYKALDKNELPQIRKLSSFSENELSEWNAGFDDKNHRWIRFQNSDGDSNQAPLIFEADSTLVFVYEKNGKKVLGRVELGLKSVPQTRSALQIQPPAPYGLGDLDSHLRGLTNNSPKPRKRTTVHPGLMVLIHLNELANHDSEDWNRMTSLITKFSRTGSDQGAADIVIAIHGTASEQDSIRNRLEKLKVGRKNWAAVSVPARATSIQQEWNYKDLLELADRQNPGKLPLINRFLKGSQEGLKLISVTRTPSRYRYEEAWMPILRILTEISGAWTSLPMADLENQLKSAQVGARQT